MSKTSIKIIVAIPAVVLLVLITLYFLFPGTVFRVLLNSERRSAGLEQKSIDVGNVHFEYLEGGKGEVLLLLHGFGGNKDNWTRIAQYLTPYYRVIAPDLPGFGESSRDKNATYSYTAQVNRLHKFINALGIRKFLIGGNSMGGNIAGIYTARFENEEEYDRLLDFVFVKRPTIPGAIKRYLVEEAISHRPLNQIIYKQIASTDTKNFVPLEILLKDNQIKTLILWGDKDRVLHMSAAKKLESVMPNAKSVIMKDVGHVPMVEKPEDSADIFFTFPGKKMISRIRCNGDDISSKFVVFIRIYKSIIG
jgi:abhydrolase domain-containing protein 6